MATPLPPIYRDIRRLFVHSEGVVSRFARYHKYTLGTDMRPGHAAYAMRTPRGVQAPHQPLHVGALLSLVLGNNAVTGNRQLIAASARVCRTKRLANKPRQTPSRGYVLVHPQATPNSTASII